MTPGTAVYLLKTKALRKKKYTPLTKYEPKLDLILNKRMRVRRLIPSESNIQQRTNRQSDVRMDSEEEGNHNEEEKKEGQ